MTIPRIIHQMWFDKNELDNNFLPENHERYSLYSTYVKGLRDNHPDYQYIFWNGRRIYQLWNEPRLSKWKNFFYSLKYHIEKCDMTRYAILFIYGGIYIDLDYKSHRPFDSSLLDHKILFIREPPEHQDRLSGIKIHIANSIIFSSPNHFIWPIILDAICKEYNTNKDDNAVGHTGPRLLARVLNRINAPETWFMSNCLFMPYMYGGTKSKVCTDDQVSQAYTSTIWTEGTGWGREYNKVYFRSAIGYAIPIVLIILSIIFLLYLYFSKSTTLKWKRSSTLYL